MTPHDCPPMTAMHTDIDPGTLRRAEQAMRDEAWASSSVATDAAGRPVVVAHGRRTWADWYAYYLRQGLSHGDAAERAAERSR